jgi:cytochrome c2
MPSSLRLVLILLVMAFGSAPIAVAVLHSQKAAQERLTAEQLTGGDSERGRRAIARYGCGGCHVIQGISGADGTVGPSLGGIAQRAELAGHLSNQPANMIRWIRRPQQVSPGSGMPDLGVSEQDGRDISAYLYTMTQPAVD